MTKVICDISMSLDGFVTAPDAGPGNGLGRGGDVLHRWAFSPSEADTRILREGRERTGAVVMGRRTFDVVDAPDGWGEERNYGGDADGAGPPPVVVMTHEAPRGARLADVATFATGGPEEAASRARDAAGDRDVVVMGGAATVDAFLREGLADELVLHLVPVLLGAGTRLFAHAGDRPAGLEPVSVVAAPGATHVRYRVTGAAPV